MESKENRDPAHAAKHGSPGPKATAGLCNGLNDATGEFRIGDVTLKIRGDAIIVKQGDNEAEVAPQSLEGLLREEYFVDHKHA